MALNGDTTQREEDSSVAAGRRAGAWLRWVFPAAMGSVALEHGLVVGRDDACSCRLTGHGVSRRHVEFQRQGPLFALRDLGSTNGTFLNGRRIEHAPVVPGGVLRLGAHIGVFSECAESPREFQALTTNLFGGHELEIALKAARRVASTDISVAIVGATGTGKECVARAIHEFSGRKGPFHAINCAALPKDLAESELFGHRKGAFTGAERPNQGHFRAADGGTLFLDEVAELPLSVQAKLLRVTEERSVMSLGETVATPINVRIICATQQPFGSVGSPQFRVDLAARLAGLTVLLPPLRERVADVAPLFGRFIDRYSGGRPPDIDSKLIECLCLHDWPGNVRELEQLSRRMLAVHGLEGSLRRSFLPAGLRALVSDGDSSTQPAVPTPERREHDVRRLASALRQSGGVVSSAALLAGFSRQRAYRLLGGASATDFIAEEERRSNSLKD